MTGTGARGHIVAMGGGGFLMEPENPLLDDFVLSLARRQPAQVCFLPTACADSGVQHRAVLSRPWRTMYRD